MIYIKRCFDCCQKRGYLYETIQKNKWSRRKNITPVKFFSNEQRKIRHLVDSSLLFFAIHTIVLNKSSASLTVASSFVHAPSVSGAPGFVVAGRGAGTTLRVGVVADRGNIFPCTSMKFCMCSSVLLVTSCGFGAPAHVHSHVLFRVCRAVRRSAVYDLPPILLVDSSRWTCLE